MKLTSKRRWFTEKSTSSVLLVDLTTQCFVLEDVARPDGVKIPGKTCIPAGEYKVVLDFSNRFQRIMPHVLDVPMFTGVRIHPGNTAENTEGCLLTGAERMPDTVMRSREAFDALMVKLQEATDRQEPITLNIINEPL